MRVEATVDSRLGLVNQVHSFDFERNFVAGLKRDERTAVVTCDTMRMERAVRKDVAYYLLKEHKVVGVEANPALCAEVEARFASEIADGRLVVLNCALSADDSAGQVDFYIHNGNHVLSQVDRPDAEVLGDFHSIRVEARSPVSIIREYGEPRYVKVDLEGFDVQVLRAIFAAGIHPPEISAESHSVDVFACLVEEGYRSFNLVEGWSVDRVYGDATIKTPAGPRRFRFRPHSAGPFGEDVGGEWEDPDSFLHTLAAAGLGWKDIHASDLIAPGPPPPFQAQMRREVTAITRKLVRGVRSRFGG